MVEPNIDLVTAGALRGLLESLDSDSSYLTRRITRRSRRGRAGRRRWGQRGQAVRVCDGGVSSVPGSPADKASLEDGDIIESIGTDEHAGHTAGLIGLMMEGKAGCR